MKMHLFLIAISFSSYAFIGWYAFRAAPKAELNRQFAVLGGFVSSWTLLIFLFASSREEAFADAWYANELFSYLPKSLLVLHYILHLTGFRKRFPVRHSRFPIPHYGNRCPVRSLLLRVASDRRTSLRAFAANSFSSLSASPNLRFHFPFPIRDGLHSSRTLASLDGPASREENGTLPYCSGSLRGKRQLPPGLDRRDAPRFRNRSIDCPTAHAALCLGFRDRTLQGPEDYRYHHLRAYPFPAFLCGIHR